MSHSPPFFIPARATHLVFQDSELDHVKVPPNQGKYSLYWNACTTYLMLVFRKLYDVTPSDLEVVRYSNLFGAQLRVSTADRKSESLLKVVLKTARGSPVTSAQRQEDLVRCSHVYLLSRILTRSVEFFFAAQGDRTQVGPLGQSPHNPICRSGDAFGWKVSVGSAVLLGREYHSSLI